jgi:hypothetical protein
MSDSNPDEVRLVVNSWLHVRDDMRERHRLSLTQVFGGFNRPSTLAFIDAHQQHGRRMFAALSPETPADIAKICADLRLEPLKFDLQSKYDLDHFQIEAFTELVTEINERRDHYFRNAED